ncbi:MAG: rhodanese-like domain-containing protein [Haloarculaceae archaeon]
MDGEITPEELQEIDDARIVDIRNPRSFSEAHIPDSENVPLEELTDRIETFDDADHVVTVCPHGKASVQAARLIGAYEGFDGRVESLAGGLEAWDGPLAALSNADSGADAAPNTDPETDTGADGPEAPF